MSQFVDSFLYNIRKEFQNVDVSGLVIYMILVALLVHICSVLYAKKSKKTISIGNEIIYILLLWYVGLVASVTFFNRAPGSVEKVFQTKLLIWEANINQNMTNILNVLLFVPFGVLICVIESKSKTISKIIAVVCTSFLFGLLIEVLKYTTRRGYFELDNIEGGIIGAILGAMIVSLVRLMMKKKEDARSEEVGQE